MAVIPAFETVAIVGDKPTLVAEFASLFSRSGRYLAIMDGPRMSRPDASNEVIRRTNALLNVKPRRILLADIPQASSQELSVGWQDGTVISVSTVESAGHAVKDLTNVPFETMPWGDDNLGVGLQLARRTKMKLRKKVTDIFFPAPLHRKINLSPFLTKYGEHGVGRMGTAHPTRLTTPRLISGDVLCGVDGRCVPIAAIALFSNMLPSSFGIAPVHSKQGY